MADLTVDITCIHLLGHQFKIVINHILAGFTVMQTIIGTQTKQKMYDDLLRYQISTKIPITSLGTVLRVSLNIYIINNFISFPSPIYVKLIYNGGKCCRDGNSSRFFQYDHKICSIIGDISCSFYNTALNEYFRRCIIFIYSIYCIMC